MSPSLMPKLGKAGSLQSRQAIVHSLVHTESWAIDLSWVFLFSFIKLIVSCVVSIDVGKLYYNNLLDFRPLCY